jgi:hypothetical protein
MKTAKTLAVISISLAGCAGQERVPDAISSYSFDEQASRVILYQLADEKCELQGKLVPMPVDRELEIVGEMYGDYDSEEALGSLEVKVAGVTVIGSSLRKSQNVLREGRMVAARRLWIRSNEIANVSAKGTVKGGRCVDLRVRVRDSLPATLARSTR